MTKKDKKVKMSVPEGIEFGTPYNMNTTFHNEYYWDTNRNGKDTIKGISFSERLDIQAKTITDLLKDKNKAYRE